MQDTRYKIQNTGYRIQDTGYRIQDTGYRIQDTGYRTVRGGRGYCRIQEGRSLVEVTLEISDEM